VFRRQSLKEFGIMAHVKKNLWILFLNWEYHLGEQRDFLKFCGFFPRMALKSSYNLFLLAEYFVFQEKVSRSFGSPLHAKAFFSIFSNLNRFELKQKL